MRSREGMHVAAVDGGGRYSTYRSLVQNNNVSLLPPPPPPFSLLQAPPIAMGGLPNGRYDFHQTGTRTDSVQSTCGGVSIFSQSFNICLPKFKLAVKKKILKKFKSQFWGLKWPKFDKSHKIKVVEHPQIMLGGWGQIWILRSFRWSNWPKTLKSPKSSNRFWQFLPKRLVTHCSTKKKSCLPWRYLQLLSLLFCWKTLSFRNQK